MVSTVNQPRVADVVLPGVWAKMGREEKLKKRQQRATLRVEYRFIAWGKSAREYREAAN